MSQVIYISPCAFLRSMAAIAWSAFTDPFRTTVIDLSTGRVVEYGIGLTSTGQSNLANPSLEVVTVDREVLDSINARLEQLEAIARELRESLVAALHSGHQKSSAEREEQGEPPIEVFIRDREEPPAELNPSRQRAQEEQSIQESEEG